MARISAKTDTDRILEAVGSAIRAARISLGISQEALAHASGIDRSHMGKIERGERNVTLMNLARICRALGKLPSDMLHEAGM